MLYAHSMFCSVHMSILCRVFQSTCTHVRTYVRTYVCTYSVSACCCSLLQDALGQQLWNALGDTLNLVQTDPTRVVTAMKIVEREEMLVLRIDQWVCTPQLQRNRCTRVSLYSDIHSRTFIGGGRGWALTLYDGFSPSLEIQGVTSQHTRMYCMPFTPSFPLPSSLPCL